MWTREVAYQGGVRGHFGIVLSLSLPRRRSAVLVAPLQSGGLVQMVFLLVSHLKKSAILHVWPEVCCSCLLPADEKGNVSARGYLLSHPTTECGPMTINDAIRVFRRHCISMRRTSEAGIPHEQSCGYLQSSLYPGIPLQPHRSSLWCMLHLTLSAMTFGSLCFLGSSSVFGRPL